MNLLNQPPRQKTKRPLRSKKHRQFVASLPCLICLYEPCQAAHVRISWYRGGGKPPDNMVVPLCPPRLGTMGCHASQHTYGSRNGFPSAEAAWWAKHGISPLAIAAQLWEASGDDKRGREIIRSARDN